MKKNRHKNDKNDKGILSKINGPREGEEKEQKLTDSPKESGKTRGNKKEKK
jgi:hypothetical protein